MCMGTGMHVQCHILFKLTIISLRLLASFKVEHTVSINIFSYTMTQLKTDH